MTGKYAGPLLLSAWLLTQPAMAQRTDENAVREAEDGFGKSVGSDSVGIYASGNVRGRRRQNDPFAPLLLSS